MARSTNKHIKHFETTEKPGWPTSLDLLIPYSSLSLRGWDHRLPKHGTPATPSLRAFSITIYQKYCLSLMIPTYQDSVSKGRLLNRLLTCVFQDCLHLSLSANFDTGSTKVPREDPLRYCSRRLQDSSHMGHHMHGYIMVWRSIYLSRRARRVAHARHTLSTQKHLIQAWDWPIST